MELLEKNLSNQKTRTTLFGVEEKVKSMESRIGFYPVSVWQPDWNIVARMKKIVGDFGQTRVAKKSSTKSYGYWKKDGRYRGKQDDISIFNPHLAMMILSAYAPIGARIYDPYAGGGTRGFIASMMGHSYSGVEIRKEEVERIKEHQKKMDVGFEIMVADACSFKPEKTFNFSYTCPPYYNLEVYSDLPEDTSNAKTYEEFLEMTKRSLKNVFECLEPNSLSLWVVGNFRDKRGNLIHFNGDMIRLAKEVGFKFHDEIVFWKETTRDFIRTGVFEANRKSVRVHEYILIFKKN